MAADTQPKAVNGNYGSHQLYDQAESFQTSQSSNASNGTAVVLPLPDEALVASAATPSESTGATDGSKSPSKDEVGWYFVESYYTTMSKNPDTLYVRHLLNNLGTCPGDFVVANGSSALLQQALAIRFRRGS